MSLPNPYYDDGKGIVIYHGDCRGILPNLFLCDVIITDPPYGETSLLWDKYCNGWNDLAAMAIKPGGSLWCFGSLRMFIAHAKSWESWKLAQDVVWEKQNGSGFHSDRFKRVHEHACQFYFGKWEDVYKDPVFTMDATAKTVRKKGRPAHTGHIDATPYVSFDGGPRLMTSVINVPNCHGYADHPTQKPVGIIAPLIQYSCPPLGSIIDPFMGSGTTLVAAKAVGKKCIGIEIEEKYCEIAARRLGQEVLAL